MMGGAEGVVVPVVECGNAAANGAQAPLTAGAARHVHVCMHTFVRACMHGYLDV